MNNCRDFILTVFAVLALALPNLVAAPHAWNMFSGSYAGGRGPAWMTLTIQGEQENEEWWFESANFSWDQKNIGSSANVFDDLLKVQRFKVGTTPKIVQFVYRLPKAVLELDTISTTLSVTFRTSGNALVGPISVSESGVDIVKRREFYWDRFAGSQPIVAAYQPGNYLTFDYYGAGLFATLGIASNMGKVQIDLDGVKGKSLDLYPTDLPATANITNSIRTDYRKTRIIATGSKDNYHRVTLTVLPKPNPLSGGNTFALSSFAVERHSGNTSIIYETDVATTNANLLLYSPPGIFDGNVLLGLLVFGANVDSLLASVAGNTSGVTSGNTTGNTIGSTTGSSSNTTSSNTSGNTSAKTFLETNFAPFQPFYAPRQQASLASDTFVVLSLDNGKNQTSMVLDSLEGQRVELTELDRVHSLQIHVVNPLGLTESAQGFYIVTLSQPTSWPAGQSQLSLTYLGQTLQLLRTDTSATWEVGVIDSNGILAETGKKILVVQKSGTYQPLDFQVSYGAGVKPLNGTASSSSATSLTLQKSNFVELNAASSSSSSVSSVGATGSSSGGGGGGCLLR